MALSRKLQLMGMSLDAAYAYGYFWDHDPSEDGEEGWEDFSNAIYGTDGLDCGYHGLTCEESLPHVFVEPSELTIVTGELEI